ncbi:MAG: TlpA family protein disulfide reductase [Clostridiales bacterium]|nr:TlpA family protein disulfide reductase [Clostridiales bacterium]
MAFLLSLILLVSCVTTGLAAPESIFVNPEFDEKEMKNIHGENVIFEEHAENLVGYVDLGFAFIVPTFMNGWDETSPWQIDDGMHHISYVYFPKALMPVFLGLRDIQDQSAIEEASRQIEEGLVHTFSVLRVNPALTNNDVALEDHKDTYEHVEEFAKNGDETIYLCYNTTFENEMLTQDEKTELAKFVEEGLQIVKSTLILFPPIFQDGGDPGDITLEGGAEAFAANDLDGKPFDTSLFSQYDLTVVNVWYTWCGYCVEEMPDLQKLYESLPENVNLITVCLDGTSENDLAKEIVSVSGATFQTLQGDELAKTVLSSLYAFPTNIFLDKDGKLAGDPIVGQMGASGTFVQDALKIIEERLQLLGK